MVAIRQERRQMIDGSLICENGILRLWVVRVGSSLGLELEAWDSDTQWVPLALSPADEVVCYIAADGQRRPVRFVAFDPVQVQGQTRGITLYAYIDDTTISLTTLLSPTGTWCHHRLEISGGTSFQCRRLTHRWQLASIWDAPEIHWPNEPVYGFDLTSNPAAIMQTGPVFLALIPDLEEGECGVLGLQRHEDIPPIIEFGISTPDDQTVTIATPTRFAYTFCLDARALPALGFQQVVRYLGSHDALPMVMPTHIPPRRGNLQPLPPPPDTTDWFPFRQEGTPAEIASLARHYLTRARHEDWRTLEKALCWLDRLCLHQHIYEVPGGMPLGTIGNDPQWDIVAQWMPDLFFEAFQLTGITEYAYRGIAALATLPNEKQAIALGYLHPKYGDIYLHADYEKAMAISLVEHFSATFELSSIHLAIDLIDKRRPLLLVLDGSDPSYTLVVNGKTLEPIPVRTLQEGINLTLDPLSVTPIY